MAPQPASTRPRKPRSPVRWGAGLVALWLVTAAPGAQDQDQTQDQSQDQGEVLYRGLCGACHSLQLPDSQRLNRANWEWVLDDMVEKFGCPMTDEQRALILEYLVEHRGPDAP